MGKKSGNKETRTMVPLEDVHIGISPVTGEVYVGTVTEDGSSWIKKVKRTPEFFVTLLNFCPPGTVQTISGGGQSFGIYVKDVTAIATATPEEMAEALAEAEGRQKPKKASGLYDALGKKIVN